DMVALLVRPTHDRHRQVLPAEALFEPGRAILTDAGRAKLDEFAPWFHELKWKGSDVVIASYADPRCELTPEAARALTQTMSEVVVTYLKDHHKVHKLGLLSWRDVKPLGCGYGPPPQPEPGL